MGAVELTPRGRGGVSVLEVRGDVALRELVRGWPAEWSAGAAPRLLKLGGAGLGFEEEALVWWRPDGAFEVHVHGSPPLVERLLVLLNQGADGGALDLGRGGSLEARAAALLEGAETRAAARVLLDQAEGALRRELEAWRVADGPGRARIAEELARGALVARRLVEPARVVLVGPVNMGKSTLFNLIVGAERVVVSKEAGTTRDLIEAPAQLGAYPIRLVDTAGLRTAEGAFQAVEGAGQVQGAQAAEAADWVLWLDTGWQAFGLRSRGRVTRFRARADEPAGAALDWPALAPLAEPERTLATVRAGFRAALELPEAPWERGRGMAFDAATFELVERLNREPNSPATRQALDSALS